MCMCRRDFLLRPIKRYRKLKDTTALKDTTTARIFYTAVLGVASHRRRVVVSTISSCAPALKYTTTAPLRDSGGIFATFCTAVTTLGPRVARVSCLC